jgi:hypothetical protein
VSATAPRRAPGAPDRFGRSDRGLFERSAVRAFVLVLACCSVFAAGAGAAGSTHSSSQLISFYGNLTEPINGGAVENPLVVRPTTLALAADGHWVITNLRWSGWGGSVARATGLSSASDCNPSCAGGKSTTSPAQFIVSNPGRVQGHEVYRCFQLTIPSRSEADEHACLTRQGSSVLYLSASHATAPAATSKTVHLASFLSPDRRVWCRLIKDPTEDDAWCGTMPLGRVATLKPNGIVTICTPVASGDCLQNWDSSAPVLPLGKQSELNGFRCISEATAITCSVIAGTGRGRGFSINATSVRRVAP